MSKHTHTTITILILLSQYVQTQKVPQPLPELPTAHLIRYLNTFPQLWRSCHNDDSENCPFKKDALDPTLCWGYEQNCKAEQRLQTLTCLGDHTGWVRSKQAQLDAFFYQADFGYVRQQRDELKLICEPNFITDSSLECTQYLRFCRGRNLLFDFRDLIERPEPIRYSMDVLQPGQLLGHCRYNRTQLQQELDHYGALQSWAPELRNFDELPVPPIGSPESWCDKVIETPTFIMKIDATYNMYHHFCDFFNLYASLFVNQSHPLAFDTNVQILIWETYPYDSPFAETFSAFSRHPVWTLNEVKGQRICFRNLVLPLLPRMIFGLFYNTPIIQGCQGSSLFRAFSEFILHRLKVPFYAPTQTTIRITFLSRRTKYRQVLNENELIEEISSNAQYYVRRISFDRGLSFAEQLAITRNTDILIGMHGAGLTHLLFLPNWAAIFELHNCEDPNCYKDLARLRGVHYLTWQRQDLVYPQDEGHHPQGGAHAKFTNYSFDRYEFSRLVALAANYVQTHNEFKAYQEINSRQKDEL